MTMDAAPTSRRPFVSAVSLAETIGRSGATIVDATYYAKSERLDLRASFESKHLPGARFFDIDAVAREDCAVPHMLPGPREFEKSMGALGIDSDKPIVVYDRHYLRSAPRVWWTFRRFGHADVRILDGGLEVWEQAGFPVETGPSRHAATRYVARPNDSLVRSLDDARQNALSGSELYIDARSPQRFRGEEDDTWTGRRGHIRGSVNVPATSLRTADGRLKTTAEIETVFEPVLNGRNPVATCGSGISAAIIALSLYQLGYEHVPVYDGSWAEWAQAPNTEALTHVGRDRAAGPPATGAVPGNGSRSM